MTANETDNDLHFGHHTLPERRSSPIIVWSHCVELFQIGIQYNVKTLHVIIAAFVATHWNPELNL